MGDWPYSVLANVLDYDIVVSEFEFQSRYNVHFWNIEKIKELWRIYEDSKILL